VYAGEDNAAVELKLLELIDIVVLFVRRVDRSAIKAVPDFEELERTAELIDVADRCPSVPDRILNNLLSKQIEARLGAEDVLLQLVKLALQLTNADAIGTVIRRLCSVGGGFTFCLRIALGI
jgi:hypothetical protein